MTTIFSTHFQQNNLYNLVISIIDQFIIYELKIYKFHLLFKFKCKKHNQFDYFKKLTFDF
jgi:hypothetical protein